MKSTRNSTHGVTRYLTKLVPLSLLALVGLTAIPAHAGIYNGVDFVSFVTSDFELIVDQNGGYVVPNPGAAVPQSIIFNDNAFSSGGGSKVICRSAYTQQDIDWFWDTDDIDIDPAPLVRPVYSYQFVT